MHSTTEWQTLPVGSIEIVSRLIEVIKGLWSDDTARRNRMLRNISMFEGRGLDNLDPSAYRSGLTLTTEEGATVQWNIVRSLVTSLVAKVAGTQQPKVRALMSNADWKTRRKGPKLDALMTGLWSTSQPPYADIWEMASYALRDACVCNVGYIKSEADTQMGDVRFTKPFPWEVLFSADDACNGTPQNCFQHYRMPRAQLLAWHPEHKAAIQEADSTVMVGDLDVDTNIATQLSLGDAVVEQVEVFEWWQLARGPDSPGRHVKAIRDCVLVDEEWHRTTFPFADFTWDRGTSYVADGNSVVDDVASINEELNTVLKRIARSTELTSMGVLYKRIGSTTNVSVSSDDAVTIEFDGPDPGHVYDNPAPCSQFHLDWVKMQEDAAHRYTGLNQTTTAAQRQPGVDSAVAMRMLNDTQSERLSVAWKRYQALFVKLAKDSIAAIRELQASDHNFAVQWPGESFLKSIDWSKIDLDDDKYVFQIASAPAIKDTPADRMQAATEHYAAGRLSADAYMAVQTYLDLPGELARANAQRNLIDQYIETWLDAEPDEIEENETADGSMVLRPPIAWMRLEDAMLQVADALVQAQIDGIPDENEELFLRWLEMAEEEIQKRQQRKAELQARQQANAAPGPQVAPGGPAM